MTIIKHEKIQIRNFKGTLINKFRNRVIIKCDYCKKEKIFEKCLKSFIEKQFHYCCQKCFHHSLSDGVSAIMRKEKFKEKTGYDYPTQMPSVKNTIVINNLLKYGVENISQLESIKNKKKQTSINNYGVEYPLQSPIVMEKVKETNIKKYGSANAMNNSEIVFKLKETIMNKYGVENISSLLEFKIKKEETLNKNYGVKNPMFSEEIRSRIDATIEEKYGQRLIECDVDNIFQLPEIKLKREAGIYKKYGVINPMFSNEIKLKLNYADIFKKAQETKKKNGTYKTSKIEDLFYDELCKYFNIEDIERQKITNGWFIDFYIKHLNIYIQFDGVYWHGLNRDIETIKNSGKSRDEGILKTIKRDLLQKEWFNINNEDLIRITDKEYYNYLKLIKNNK